MAPSPKSETSPLHPQISEGPSSNTPNRLTQGAINVLSISRLVAGTASIVAPGLMVSLFRITVSGPGALILPRMFGVRDGVLAELLWTADGTQNDKRELKRALWAGLATDTLDLASCVFGLATGTLSKPAFGLLGGGAMVFMALGTIGLRGV
ncbi:hypothetical protein BU16DRAFT_527613 [Lophium mytilinum]|uniref:Uncharacterized protein n=1 Tax=Lophium mytilinum TaxID=390894 RepID=A0A6A6QQ70_9PEZI|nr:hypothetical protein BU16DRAFT_527613 [Lophium mytilinum]